MKSTQIFLFFIGFICLCQIACKEDPVPTCETPKVWYADVDGDGFGDPSNPIEECEQPTGFVDNDRDVDDSQSGVDTIFNTQKVSAYFRAIENRDTSLIMPFVSQDNFEQHSPFVEDKAEGLTQFILDNPADIEIDIHRLFFDDNLYIAHSTYAGSWNNSTPQVVFDVFRFDNGTIVEHWDNFTNVQSDMDTTTQTNGPVNLIAAEQVNTNANRLIIQNMTEDVLLDGIDTTYSLYFAPIENYTQHAVGVDPTQSRFEFLLDSLPDDQGIYNYVEFINAFGQFVWVLSEASRMEGMDTVHVAHYDLFRLDNDLIVEHWEIVQDIPTEGLANSNGKW